MRGASWEFKSPRPHEQKDLRNQDFFIFNEILNYKEGKILEKTITKLSEIERQIDLFIPNDEFKPFYDKIFEDVRKNADLKGFRKGKVPPNLIKQMFGRQIEAEAIEDAINHFLNKIFEEEKISLIGEPKSNGFEKKDDGFSISFKFDSLPEFQLQDYRGLTIDEPIHNVTDEEIDEEIDKICRIGGNYEPAEQIIDEFHVVRITLREVDDMTHLPIIGAKPEESTVYLASNNVPLELKHTLLNGKIGDIVFYNPSIEDKFAPKKLYEITIEDIIRVVSAEFNNEFVQHYTKGELMTTDELSEDIGFKQQDQWNKRSREIMEQNMIEKLVNMHDIELPDTLINEGSKKLADSILKDYEKKGVKSPVGIDSISEDLKPLAKRTIKWELIRDKIIEREQLQVEDYDLDEIVESEAERLKSDPDSIRRQLMKNKDLINQIEYKKIMDLLLDYAITREVNFDGSEYIPPEEDEIHIHDENSEHDNDEYVEHIHNDIDESSLESDSDTDK